ncbi:MAG: DUF4127 family protein [Candidatus Eremiobacteraeota bacterium]|nr:DUF4127 family protein [Candidatus Eremiobacteraeota bacterium]
MVLRAAVLGALFVLACASTGSAKGAEVAFVPLDDRPVTLQLPQMLGAIAGAKLDVPPRALLGNYLTFGDPSALRAWLARDRAAEAYVISTDMLAYGGLVASRVPGVDATLASSRLDALNELRRTRPRAWIGGFATVMRLAPTGVPALGAAANFFAASPLWEGLQEYANLHDPPLPAEEADATRLRGLLGPALPAYLDTRKRNLDVDLHAVQLVGNGALDYLVLGQDDAGPVGLHLKDVASLRAAIDAAGVAPRTSVEPGADELGMALVARVLARHAGWTPRVAVRYSRPGGAAFNDPLEFAPIDVTIDRLIGLCGATRDDATPEIELFVRLPNASEAEDRATLDALSAEVERNRSAALVDLSFLEPTFVSQERFARALVSRGIAGKLDAYASWNTTANSAGTALAETIAAGAGRRSGTYDERAHAEFTLNRYVDDVGFHDDVRPELNAALDVRGVPDHTYLLPDEAALTDHENRAALVRRADSWRDAVFPQYRYASLRIVLPWDRTFETQIDLTLSP